jgi:S-layer homology domain
MRANRKRSRMGTLVVVGLPMLLLVRSMAAQTPLAGQSVATSSRSAPAYGTTDYTVTTIAGLGFAPGSNGMIYNVSGSIARAVNAIGGHFYSALDIPAGSVIDYIGFNNLNDLTPNVMAIHLWVRDASGTPGLLFSLDNTPHDTWATDINPVALGILWDGSQGVGRTLILDMEIAPSANTQFFASVEVWWKRTVSPAPGTASFNDVPTDHPFFQYIEALKASGITGGCNASPPLYCPDDPVTRGQMAVFLAKALGLHWPN